MLDNYHIDEFGAIYQTEYKLIEYDEEYLSYYTGLIEHIISFGFIRFV